VGDGQQVRGPHDGDHERQRGEAVDGRHVHVRLHAHTISRHSRERKIRLPREIDDFRFCALTCTDVKEVMILKRQYPVSNVSAAVRSINFRKPLNIR